MTVGAIDGINRIGNRSLPDVVKKKLLTYMVTKAVEVGSLIPTERDISAALGVSHTVVRKALAPLKLLGIITGNGCWGTRLTNPILLVSLDRLYSADVKERHILVDALIIRQALEIGIADGLFKKITNHDIAQLSQLCNLPSSMVNNLAFHEQLIKIAGDNIFIDFEKVINLTVNMPYILQKKIAVNQTSNLELLDALRRGEKEAYVRSVRRFFEDFFEVLP